MKEVDFDIKEEMIGALLLSGLPSKYKPIIMAIENAGMTITADTIKVKLLQEVTDSNLNEEDEQGTAFLIKTNKGRGKYNSNKPTKCQICNKIEHSTNKCWFKNKKKPENKKESEEKTINT